MMRDCTVLAVEGTHASGKTTLTLALAAYYRERSDLLDELADVIITAAVAMSGVAGDVYQARSHLEGRIRTVATRAGLQAAPADS